MADAREPYRHYHCPNDCDKPQPQEDPPGSGRMICLACLYRGLGEIECVLCTPETCDD